MYCLPNQEIPKCWPGMMAHAYNLSTQRLGQEDCSLRLAWNTKRVQGYIESLRPAWHTW